MCSGLAVRESDLEVQKLRLTDRVGIDQLDLVVYY